MKLEYCCLTVNYDLPIDQGIAAGDYRFISDNITEAHFPSSQIGISHLVGVLVRLRMPGGRTLAHAERYLRKNRLRPATLHELLAFGSKYQNAHGKRAIVALGTIWISPNDGGLYGTEIERVHPEIRPALKNVWSLG